MPFPLVTIVLQVTVLATTPDAIEPPATPRPRIVISEIMYNPASPERRGETEWVELCNVGTDPVDLHGWRLDDEDTRSDWSVFDCHLDPGGVVVLVNAAHVSEATFRDAWAVAEPVSTEPRPSPTWQVKPVKWGGLSNRATATDEILCLRDAAGEVVCTVNYEAGGDWPRLAGAGGPSIVLTDARTANPGVASSWRRAEPGVDGARRGRAAGLFTGLDIGSPGVVSGLAAAPPPTAPRPRPETPRRPDSDRDRSDGFDDTIDFAPTVSTPDLATQGAFDSMKYRRLGMWGIRLSEIGYGSWLNFNDADQEQANALHRAAYENGINFFDTANAYGAGGTESVVGRALEPFQRDTYVLATKLFWPIPDWPFPGANDRGLSRKHIMEQCDVSLKRLRTDYLDLYQCHRYDEETPVVETCRAMNDLIDRGKVLYWGVSEWAADQISAAAQICEEHGWHRPVSNQPLYNMLERHWEPEVFPMCRRLGMGIVNFSPLCEGLLTGKYVDGTPSDSRAANDKYGQFIAKRLTDENLAIVRRLKEVADGLGVPMTHLVLAWCLRRPEVTSTIIGASRPEQIVENVGASDLVLDDAVLDKVSGILGG